MKKLFILLFIGLCFTSMVFAANIMNLSGQEIENTTKAIRLNPLNAELYYRRGIEYYENCKAYNNLYVLNLVDTKIDDALAYGVKSTEAGTHALADFTKTIEIKPRFADAYYYRGLAYDELGKSQKAIQDLNTAIELHPENIKFYSARGNIYMKAGLVMEFKRGQNVGDTLPLEKKDYIEAAENSSKAIRDYTKVIEIDPKNGDGYFNLANSSYHRGLAYKKMGLLSPAFDDFYQAAILFSEIKWKPEGSLPPIVFECVGFMKKINPASPLIKQLMDKINKSK